MIDGTLIPIDRVAADRPFYSGKHRMHGMNIQVITRSHARLRAPGERGNAQLKSWRILRKLRCCPHRAGHLVKAIHVLQTREADG